jgi:hypothetical protein
LASGLPSDGVKGVGSDIKASKGGARGIGFAARVVAAYRQDLQLQAAEIGRLSLVAASHEALTGEDLERRRKVEELLAVQGGLEAEKAQQAEQLAEEAARAKAAEAAAAAAAQRVEVLEADMTANEVRTRWWWWCYRRPRVVVELRKQWPT